MFLCGDRYTMLWSRDDLMSYLLVKMSKRISDKVGQILAAGLYSCSRCAADPFLIDGGLYFETALRNARAVTCLAS